MKLKCSVHIHFITLFRFTHYDKCTLFHVQPEDDF